MKILVTGGAGFIGSHLINRLLQDGHELTVIDDFNNYYSPRVKTDNLAEVMGQVKVMRFDIVNDRQVMRVFEQGPFEAVFHLAARAGVRPSIENPTLYERVNGVGTMNILEACRAFQVPRLIFASSSSVYGGRQDGPFKEDDDIKAPVSPYAATKRANELMCYTMHHLTGLAVTCLRFFTVYGPRQRPDMAIHKFTRAIMRGESIPQFGDGRTKRDYTFISDIIDGVVASLRFDKGYRIINLGAGRTIELKDMISEIAQACQKEAKIEVLPDQPGDVPLTSADISLAKECLDYQPKTDFKAGIQSFVEWYLESVHPSDKVGR